MKRLALAILLILCLTASGWTPREDMHRWINHARVSRGIAPLGKSLALRIQANQHSARMRDAGRIFHSTLRCSCGEIVGVNGGGFYRLFVAFMDSRAHRSIILDRRWDIAGVGFAAGGGFIWVTVIFKDVN